MIRFNSRADRFRAEAKVFLRLWEELRLLRDERGRGFPGCLTCNPAIYDLGRGECRSCVLDWEWARNIEAEIAALERRVWQAASRESRPDGVSNAVCFRGKALDLTGEALDLAFEFTEDMARR